jgi:ABC-type transport system involved in multi-copper enzyme maturation permease subunit
VNARILYHVAKADFLERVRGYRFLVVLGLAIAAAFFFVQSDDASWVPIDLGGYRGIYDSAWIGAMVGLMSSLYLALFAFYAIKGSISRDVDTGVGQIIASTPISKGLYVLGKWLSNFSVLFIMVLIVIVAAGVLQLVRGEDTSIDVAALAAPSLIIAVPVMVLVAALAVMFETVRSLRGGFGNIVFFFFFMFAIFTTGLAASFVLQNMERSAAEVIPDYGGGWSCCMIFKSQSEQVLGRVWDGQQTFRFSGMEWDIEVLLIRPIYLGVALGFVALAVRTFDRFDGAGSGPGRVALFLDGVRRRLGSIVPGRLRGDSTPYDDSATITDLTSGPLQLTPLASRSTGFRFVGLLRAELRLMLKGLQWWWYLIAAGLTGASLVLSVDRSHGTVLPIVWLWPVLIWSSMGVREVQNRTDQLVFAAEHPLGRQLPITWLSGLIVTALMGSGVLLRLLIDGDVDGVFVWTAGALFIPSMALALGTWSGSNKAFQIGYMALWYIGPMQGVTTLDFMGLEPEAAVNDGVPLIFLGAAAVLVAMAFAGRVRQLRS